MGGRYLLNTSAYFRCLGDNLLHALTVYSQRFFCVSASKLKGIVAPPLFSSLLSRTVVSERIDSRGSDKDKNGVLFKVLRVFVLRPPRYLPKEKTLWSGLCPSVPTAVPIL